jgi:hypothetical protein
MEPIFFTIIDPLTQQETRINITPNWDIKIQVGNGLPIDVNRQQLMELGALFISLAANETKEDDFFLD